MTRLALLSTARDIAVLHDLGDQTEYIMGDCDFGLSALFDVFDVVLNGPDTQLRGADEKSPERIAVVMITVTISLTIDSGRTMVNKT